MPNVSQANGPRHLGRLAVLMAMARITEAYEVVNTLPTQNSRIFFMMHLRGLGAAYAALAVVYAYAPGP
jgi:hypothetical protein